MREISCKEIENAISFLCVAANLHLPCDVKEKIIDAAEREETKTAKNVMEKIILNLAAADEDKIPICQDTGMAVVFVELGQEVCVTGGDLCSAINSGVSKGYTEGYLRPSIVADPLQRTNTGDNTPAVIHTKIVPGDKIKLTVAPKGFGSENMSAMKMFTPAAGRKEIVDFVVKTVETAGSNPCPPIIVGVGIGGNFESCALLAKTALLRDLDKRNDTPLYQEIEAEMLEKINDLGIGPAGFGGKTTCLAVNIEYAPTHIAGLPVAVNIGCHVSRHATKIL